MFYKLKFINGTEIYKTFIVCDIITQNKLLENKKEIGEENYEFNNNIIYLDDTVENIKYKIKRIIGTDISLDEIYLFSKQTITYTGKEIYNMLSQNGQLIITQAKYLNFLANISEINIDSITKKDEYTYEDIVDLEIDNKQLTENIPIGITYNLETKYPFSSNPYKTLIEDPLLFNSGDMIVSTQNRNILLDYNTLVDNTIYVCLAQEVFKLERPQYYSNIYFPLLAKNDIDSISKLETYRKGAHNIQDTRFIDRYNEKIDFLYNIFSSKKGHELPYTDVGISDIEFIIHRKGTILIPIHTIFKIITTTSERLLIKYNSSNKTEKIFRLFTDNIATNGKKIPVLTKTKIQQISNTIGRKRSVSMFYKTNNTILTFEFYANGEIKVMLKSKITYSVKEVETYIKSKLNDLLININNVIERSGYKYDLFTSLLTRHIEIINISYKLDIVIDKPLNFDKYSKCLSNVFTVIKSDLSKGIEIDYKRIAYYNKMNSLDKYISRMIQQKYSIDALVVLVAKNFDITEDESKIKLTEWLKEAQVEQNAFENKKLKIKNTSGIPIYITKDKFSNKITIAIDKIDHMLYLETIPIFIDILLRISQLSEKIDEPINYSIEEILSAVKEIQNKKRVKAKKIFKNKSILKDYSAVPKDTLKLIEEAEKIKS